MGDPRPVKDANLSCDEFVELVTEYLEETLPTHDRERFDAHLDTCEDCQSYLAQLRVTIAAVGRLRSADLDEAARTRFLELFRHWRRR